MAGRWKYALHSVSYSGSWGQAALTLEAFLDKARELGFDGVMLMAKRPHASPLDLGEKARHRLRSQFEENDLELSCLAGYNDFTLGMERPEIPVAEMQVGYLMDLCRLARDLGGSMVRVFTGFERPDAPYERLWRTVVGCLKEASRRAAEMGIILAVQNHYDLASHHLSLVDLLREVDEPNCRAAFDAWTPTLQGEDPAAAARAVGPWIAHTTVADYQLRPRFRFHPQWVQYTAETKVSRMVSVGEGIIDYPAFFKALEEVGYAGAVAFEMCAPLLGGCSEATLDHCASRFLEYMKGYEGRSSAGVS